MVANPKILGLIAGNGRFPILFAQAAKQKENIRIIAIGVKGDTSLQIKRYVDKMYWVSPGELKKLLEILKRENIANVVMAGQVNPRNLFDKRVSFDQELKDLLTQIKDKKADTIFGAVAEKLKGFGLQLIDSTVYLKDYLPKEGVLSQRAPSESEWQDIHFGKDIAKAIAHLDIGQTVCVKQKAVLAIEALEGTDQTILRAGKIGGGNIVVVKIAKPNQDMRFDIPVVGINTMKNLIKAKASSLAIEAQKTLFLDREACLTLANKKGISIVAI